MRQRIAYGLFTLLTILFCTCGEHHPDHRLEAAFQHPPDSVKPWVFWFWMNGNISREGITRDLESLKNAGINGVLWMEVSGPWWAPDGPVEPGSNEWMEMMQWAIAEADRLGMSFDLSVDFGYGSGGPHITPDISMQQLVSSRTRVSGGRTVRVNLPKPLVDYMPAVRGTWLRPGLEFPSGVMKNLQEIDSYRDVGVFAIPASYTADACIPNLQLFDGRGRRTYPGIPGEKEVPSVPAREEVVDLTASMDDQGVLLWDAPAGDWLVIRLGYASNFKMTRPCPQAAVGLECDRLNARGIEAHFEQHLKPILEAAGDHAGRTLQYIHIDSWEALGQNWTAGFEDAFRRRRGYDIRPWLPVLAGYGVESLEKTERFLWDMRRTVSETVMSAYIQRLKELIHPYGIRFSCEPYGNLCANQLEYGGYADFPIAEFWTEREDPAPFPQFSTYWYHSMKGLASVANTCGKSRVGAEAFTGARGWIDHPYLLKSMGDEAFCQGVSHYIIHLSAHQAYDRMVPGLTHRRWGQHFNRHQTWWAYSRPYFDYLARCQLLLQQGRRAVDVACLYHEGAPLDFNDVDFSLPPGYDFDLCSSEIIRQMEAGEDGISLPTGVSYRYLVLPGTDKLTLSTAQKVEELRQAGAVIYMTLPIAGTPGLEGYPEADETVRQMAGNWQMLPAGGWREVFGKDRLKPDFEGEGLNWIHRRSGSRDVYFVANPSHDRLDRRCVFRIQGKSPSLWNPETGEIHSLRHVEETGDHRIAVELSFGPSQSWFIVFTEKGSRGPLKPDPVDIRWKTITEVEGPWRVLYDPEWGGPAGAVDFDVLPDWSLHPDSGIRYYSGTATYHASFHAKAPQLPTHLDLGLVKVIARVSLNGKDCGIAWKPPYRVDISQAVREGDNELVIEVANTWVNRMIGDERLPPDASWKNWETLEEWPEWFREGRSSPTGRYTFTTARHYTKDSPLQSSGLLGPVTLMRPERREQTERETEHRDGHRHASAVSSPDNLD
jgi:hypothetical protein